MADYMGAVIHIGGRVPKSLLPKLCRRIAAANVLTDWGGEVVCPGKASDLLALRRERDGAMLLSLFADDALWGEFTELEAFLQKHGISYDRLTDPRYEYDGEIVCFRPGNKPVCMQTNADHEPVVVASHIQAIDGRLAALGDGWKSGQLTAESALAEIDELRSVLAGLLPPGIPALESFEIAKD
jgi:hypothetical protein